METQALLQAENKVRRKADTEQTNKVVEGSQKIKTHEGCPHLCPFCYEDNKLVSWEIPEITANCQILDMNFLWHPSIAQRLKQLREKREGWYEAVCGFDYRLLTQELAYMIKAAGFIKPRLAWDGGLREQYKIVDAIKMLLKAGYKSKEIGIFMIVNWKIPIEECEMKLDVLKIQNVKVCDCCYDGGYKIAIPKDWTRAEIDSFRARCALHNQLVNYRIFADLRRATNFMKKYGKTSGKEQEKSHVVA